MSDIPKLILSDVDDVLEGLEWAIDGLTAIGPGELTCGEAEGTSWTTSATSAATYAVSRIGPAKRLMSQVSALLTDCAGMIETSYDKDCPYPAAEELVGRIDAVLGEVSDGASR